MKVSHLLLAVAALLPLSATAGHDPSWFDRHHASEIAHDLSDEAEALHQEIEFRAGNHTQSANLSHDVSDDSERLHQDLESRVDFDYIHNDARDIKYLVRRLARAVNDDYVLRNDNRIYNMLRRLQSTANQLDRAFSGHNPNPNPNPGRRLYECSATDRGHEEHWGGHRARSYNQNQAAGAAYSMCLRYHGRCVVRSCRVL